MPEVIKSPNQIIEPNKFYWNPKTKEKIFTHYRITDPRTRTVTHKAIKLTPEQMKKAQDFAAICTAMSKKLVLDDVNLRRKPDYKRQGIRKKPKEAIDVKIKADERTTTPTKK